MKKKGFWRLVLPTLDSIDNITGLIATILALFGVSSGAVVLAYLERAPKFYWYVGAVLCLGIVLCVYLSLKTYANGLKILAAVTAPPMNGGTSYPTMTKAHFEEIMRWKVSHGLPIIYIQNYSINFANILDENRVVSSIHFTNCRFVGYCKIFPIQCAWSQKQEFLNSQGSAFEFINPGPLEDRITLFQCTIDRCYFTNTKVCFQNGDTGVPNLIAQCEFSVQHL